jgi:hypothetical protein
MESWGHKKIFSTVYRKVPSVRYTSLESLEHRKIFSTVYRKVLIHPWNPGNIGRYSALYTGRYLYTPGILGT